MKGKVNLKRIISFLLMFAISFSTIQLKGTMSAKATDPDDRTLAPEVIIKADNSDLIVDRLNGKYLVQNINMGTGNFSVQANTSYDNSDGTWAIKNILCSDSTMNQSSSGSGENTKYQYNAGDNKANGFTFTIDLEKKNSSGAVVDNKQYVIYFYYEMDSTVKFSKIRISDSENLAWYREVTYDQLNNDGYFEAKVSKETNKAKIDVYDNEGHIITSNITYNGSSDNTVDVVGGKNEVEIVVSQGSVQTKYKLVITKPGKALLESLTASAGSFDPAFTSDEFNYEITVPTETKNIAFTPVSVDNSSKITVDGVVVKSGRKSANISLDEGSNKIKIIVTTEEGEVATYVINVKRAEQERSSYLSALTLSSGSVNPSFNKELTEYNVSVENSVSSIYVTPTAEDKNATIRVNGTKVSSGVPSKYINLDEGPNTINVRVTDDKGNSTTYVLKVSRKYSKDNVNLNSLSLSEGKLSPSFDPDTYLYSATVDRKTDNVRVNFESQNDKAKIFINDKEYKSGQQSDKIPLSIGANLITVKVVAENGKTTTTYKISVIRGEIEGKNDWVLVAGNWTFYDGYGNQIKNDWVKYDNKWYRLDVNGHLITGWFKEDNDWYFLRSDGKMLTGWYYEKGYWYYFHEDGKMAANKWYYLDGHKYYFNELGQMQTGWMLYGGHWYYFSSQGVMQKGWITYDKNKYYLNDDGTMRNGWIFTGKVWYYLDSTGKMVQGWQTINGKKYYFDSKGVMKTGMIFLDGRWIDLNNL